PLLQGRLFSYLDTQLSRLGSPNWPELPINRPLVKVSNNQRDGHMRYEINPGRVAYEGNKLQGNIPNQVPPSQGGFASYPEQVAGPKVRQRSHTFADHYGQAKLFWNSMAAIEREHITKALQFELSKVQVRDVRVRMLDHLHRINEVLGAQVALELGESVRTSHPTVMPNGTADSTAETALLAHATSPTSASGGLQRTKGLSLVEGQPKTPKGRKVAILAADGVNGAQVTALMQALKAVGSQGQVVGTHLGSLGDGVEATATLANTSSVLYDAIFVPGGAQSVKTLGQKGDAQVFIDEAYKHAKPIAAIGEGMELLTAAQLGRLVGSGLAPNPTRGPGLGTVPADLNAKGAASGPAEVQNLSEVGRVQRVTGDSAQQLAGYGIVVGQGGNVQGLIQQFLTTIAHHRFWGRPRLENVPA
ncbi:MAG TPA: catalase-related domain-containing protein, partial [Chloroflexota bacterium]|nr:catalase-related domain-containing protein [Chloroflexota bacterium]